MDYITIKQLSELLSVSTVTIYKHLKANKLSSKTINRTKMVDLLALESYINTNFPNVDYKGLLLNKQLTSTNKQEETAPMNDSNKIIELKGLINSLQTQLASEKKQNIDFVNENKSLYERLITVEREQKKEIQQIHNAKDEQLKMYMELLKKQSDNLLEARPQHSHNSIEDSQDAEIIETTATGKRMKTKKFTKLMHEKGYTDKQIVKIIKKQLKKHDNRFSIIDGKTIIYKDKFTDL